MARTSRWSSIWVPVTAMALAGVALVVSARPASAHTGLPARSALDGLLHPLTGPDHLLAMVAVGVLAASVSNRRVAWMTPIGFVLGMIAGGVAGMIGLQLPGVEVVIALSVIVLGLLIVTMKDNAGPWLPILAGAFGAIHGHAHGAELPASAVSLAYVAGFVLATAALHLSGTAIGLGLRRTPVLRMAAGTAVSMAGLVVLLGV